MTSKKGFTLAEVLITLAIIGVVAAMSIPALMKNMQEADIKVALRKSYSTLSGAMKSILIDQGGTIKGLYADSDQLKNGFKAKMNVVKDCNAGTSVSGNCWVEKWNYYNDDEAGFAENPSFIVSAGIVYKFGLDDKTCNSDNANHLKNGLTQCGWVFTDVNGFKKPNIIGKDIFVFHILENRVLPYGGATSSWLCAGQGYGCTADMLIK